MKKRLVIGSVLALLGTALVFCSRGNTDLSEKTAACAERAQQLIADHTELECFIPKTGN